MKFSKSQKTQLCEQLNQDFPESLNFEETHGFLCALHCGPSTLEAEQKISLILFATLDETTSDNTIKELIQDLDKSIAQSLLAAETLLLPCSLDLDEQGQVDTSLYDWLYGFFEGHFYDEPNWFTSEEEKVAEMLLPFLTAFPEIEDESLDALRTQKTVFQNLILQLPQALQDIYLFYSN